MKANLLNLVNENLLGAETALQHATAETVVRHCRDYLQMLSGYRDKLYELRGTAEITDHQTSFPARELVAQTRKAIRAAIETTVKKRNAIEILLKSLTVINGHEAAATFNRLSYQDLKNWELKSGKVGSTDQPGEKYLSVQEAVEIAGVLRRAAYVSHKIIFQPV